MSTSVNNKYLKLSSTKRLNYGSTNPGQFTLKLHEPVRGRYSLKQVYIPNSAYNVNSGNNRIPFRENGVSKVAYLPVGYYIGSDLLTQTATAMTSASGGYATYTVTQSSLPLAITITSTNSFSLQFGSFPSSSAAGLLGYAPVDTASATSQTATGLGNLAVYLSYNISFKRSSGAFTDSTGGNYNFSVPISENSLGITLYEPPINFEQVVDIPSLTDTLEISILDDDGNPIVLAGDWYIILAPIGC